MIDRKWIGYTFPAFEVTLEERQLQFFAKATMEKNPLYHDQESAKEAGYQNVLMPPTFPFSLKLAQKDPFKHYAHMGVDMRKLLHAEQSFEYFKPVVAGETLSMEPKITDIYDKKDGALEFMTEITTARNHQNEIVFTSKLTIVIRN
jgi:acyl dehydratase